VVLDEVEDVLLGYAAASAGRVELIQVDIMFAS